MIIKKVVLDNIRSYEHEEVEFPSGSTLLSGDIGSGKTSVLLAIEFGFFGLQPGQKGSAILRNGKDEGGVTLTFEVDDKEVIIERTLKRGKTISQDYSAITIDGKKEELAVTELKQRVLDLLNYPSEFSKKQNLLYKFTVYTPQESMKEIVTEDAEVRLNTLRHIFGIDKYKTIIENADVLRLKLREERRVMEGVTINLDDEKKNIARKESELEGMKISIKPLEKELAEKAAIRKIKEKEKNDISKKIEEKNELKQELGKSKVMLLSKKEGVLKNDKRIKELKTEISSFKNVRFDENSFYEIQNEISSLKKEKDKFYEKDLKINSEIQSLKIRIEEHKKVHDNLSDLQVCPTCYQEVDSVHRANVLNKSYNEISVSTRKIEDLETGRKELFEKLKDFEKKISEKEQEFTDFRILKTKLEGVAEKEKRIMDLDKENELLTRDILLLDKHTTAINDAIFSLSKFDAAFEEKEKELRDSMKQEKISEIKLAELKKEIEVYTRSIIEFREKVEKMEIIKKKLMYITELENWLNKKFIPVISFLEKNVMNSLKKEFSSLFAEWFQTLVTDNFNVRLTDDFTPIIEQQDYELDYEFLSGGERTAIALAYRLALNQVINSVMSKIKTKEIVILDEPTDGFSEQQLDKMRGVLEQLNVRQLIIVSHEQKIEGFVENVIRFKKNYGVSGKEF